MVVGVGRKAVRAVKLGMARSGQGSVVEVLEVLAVQAGQVEAAMATAVRGGQVEAAMACVARVAKVAIAAASLVGKEAAREAGKDILSARCSRQQIGSCVRRRWCHLPSVRSGE